MTQAHAIVVPLDGSKNAEAAVPAATALARLWKLPIAFVYVDPHGVPKGETEHVNEVFDRYARQLTATAGVTATAQVLSGNPADTILEYAAGARVIVLASHGRSGFRAAVLGSVADKVVRGANIPVLIVPAVEEVGPIDKGPILVALDGSSKAEAGLAIARELATGFSAQVVLVRAFDILPPPYAEMTYYAPDLSEGIEEDAREYLHRTAQPNERQLIARGAADAVIVEAADAVKASLVVMTTEGMGLARRIALGSTTDRVLHALKRPLYVVPAP
jgi:nucleotide-binding universal stress UspA family protein